MAIIEIVWLKGCSRCGRGDLFFERDRYGPFRQCIQCGDLEDLADETALACLALASTRPARETPNRTLVAA